MTVTERYRSLSPRTRMRLPYAALALAVFAAYANVYGNAFLFDDELIITQNELLRSWDRLGDLLTSSTTAGVHIAGGFYRPVQLLLYFFVYQIAGYSTAAFHLLNVALHATNACLMFALAGKLKFNRPAAFLASLLWALHPIHTEAVTYMSATADPLFACACLLGCLILLPDCSPRRMMIALPVFMLGLLSKETTAILPALLIICLFLVHDRGDAARISLRTWPLWLLTLGYTIWRLNADDFDGPSRYQHMFEVTRYSALSMYSDHFSYRAYTFLATLPAYAGLLLWPADLHMERLFNVYIRPDAPPVVLGLGMLALATAQIVWGRGERGKPLSWGLLWFGAAHFPDSGLTMAVNALFLEHWMYLPTIGLFLGLAESGAALIERLGWRKTGIAVTSGGVALSLVLAFATLRQNEVWRDPISFYTHIFHYGLATARAHNNLALAYLNEQNIPMALKEFQTAIRVDDVYAETRHNLAIGLLRLQDGQDHTQEAIDNLNRALEIDPHFFRSYEALSAIYGHRGDRAKMIYYHNRAVEEAMRYQAQ